MQLAQSLESIVTRSKDVVGYAKVISWWEFRRIPYNILVGLTELITAAIAIFLAWISESILGEPIGLPDSPILAILFVILYGFLANVLYTGGWIFELLFSRLFKRDLSVYAQAAFVIGLLFSIFLTFLPAILLTLIVLSAVLFKH